MRLKYICQIVFKGVNKRYTISIYKTKLSFPSVKKLS